MKEELITHLKEHSQGTLELIHTMDNYLLIMDLEGNVLLSSNSLTEKAGISEKEIRSSKFYELLFKEIDNPLTVYDLLLLNSEQTGLNLLLKNSDKNEYIDTLLVSSSILSNFYKDEDYILILLADMREHRKNQQHIMHSNKMLALGEMASGIAHEVNNPLTVVTGQLRILNKHIEKLSEPNEKLLELSKKISLNFDRITNIVKSLQTMSRNTTKLPMENVELERIIEAIEDLTTQKLEKMNIDFSIEKDTESTDIFCRENEILQVLLSLINNSIDSISELDKKWIKLIIRDDEESFFISVTDSGDGIDLDLQIRLFEPFFTTKSIGEGTGLGLSISKSLVESHSGKMFYDTSSSNTSFKITLPKQER